MKVIVPNLNRTISVGDVLIINFTFEAGTEGVPYLVKYDRNKGTFYLQGFDGLTSYYHGRGFKRVEELTDHITKKSSHVRTVKHLSSFDYEISVTEREDAN